MNLFEKLFGEKRLKDYIPSNARFLLTNLLGIEKTFTEEDLGDKEYKFLQEFVKENRHLLDNQYYSQNSLNLYGQYGTTNLLGDIQSDKSLLGLIKQSYNPEKSMLTTLGQFGVTKDESGNYIINDTYDFENYIDEEEMSNKQFIKFLLEPKNEFTPYEILRFVAGRFGSREGRDKGNPIKINLGPLKYDWEKDN